jgi:hypothetical protein
MGIGLLVYLGVSYLVAKCCTSGVSFSWLRGIGRMPGISDRFAFETLRARNAIAAGHRPDPIPEVDVPGPAIPSGDFVITDISWSKRGDYDPGGLTCTLQATGPIDVPAMVPGEVLKLMHARGGRIGPR